MAEPNSSLVRLSDVLKAISDEDGGDALDMVAAHRFAEAVSKCPRVKVDEVQMQRIIFMHTGSSESASASAAAAKHLGGDHGPA